MHTTQEPRRGGKISKFIVSQRVSIKDSTQAKLLRQDSSSVPGVKAPFLRSSNSPRTVFASQPGRWPPKGSPRPLASPRQVPTEC